MTTIIKPAYANSFSVTLSFASLASSTADPPAGRESTEVDNTTDLAEDGQVYYEVKAGSSPTANRTGNLGVWGADYDGSTYRRPGGITGSDGNLTLTSAGAYGTIIAVLATFIFNSTTGTVYKGLAQRSICQALGLLVLPKRYGFFFFHDSGVNLDSTGGNHMLRVTPINRQLV